MKNATQGEKAARTPFTLRVDALGRVKLPVVSFQGQEALSSAYAFEVVFLAERDWREVEASFLGRRATLTMRVPEGGARRVHGVVTELELLGARGREPGRRAFRMRLAPRMALLRRRKTSRIFQDMTVVEVVDAVLEEADVARRWSTTRPFPRRAYCLQYEETDYDFVRRVCAEDGVYFYFEQPASDAGGETVVFGNGPGGYSPIAGGDVESSVAAAEGGSFAKQPYVPGVTLRYVELRGAQRGDAEAVHAFAVRSAVRPNATELRDYDFQRPLLELVGRAGVGAHDEEAVHGPASLVAEDVVSAASSWPPADLGDALPAADAASPKLAVYDHRGDYEEPDAANPVAALHLEQHRARATLARGESSCRRLAPGHRFTLAEHAEEALNVEWVVTKVRHVGRTQPEEGDAAGPTYENRFACVPGYVSCRPKRRRFRVQQVLETAVVTGPPGEEVHTDRFGRVKVQFHWDREGKRDERSSCWIRVAQPWVGAGWGFQFVPRVGTEVVVSFLGGDVDRPMIVGGAHNGTHPVPYALPQHKTRSGIRTQSTPGADGHNELSFEDAAGEEQVYLHAQRNFDEIIEANSSSRIGGVREVHVGGSSRESVVQAAELVVGSDRTVRVDGDARLAVGRHHDVAVAGEHTTTVAGPMTTTVLSPHTLDARGGHTVVVGTEGDTHARSDQYVYGSHALGAKGRIAIRADEGIVLSCGASTIELLPDKVVLSAKSIESKVTSSFTASKKDGPAMTLGPDVEILAKKLRVFTESGALEMDTAFKARGDTIDLGYTPKPDTRNDGAGRVATKPLKLRLTDWFLDPYASKKVHLVVDGTVYEAETDGSGVVSHDVPADAKEVTVRLFTGQYPEGEQRTYRVELGPLAPASEVRGAQQRLKNLGYYRGAATGAAGDELRAAVASFQQDHAESHRLSITGELDDATKRAIGEAHGG